MFVIIATRSGGLLGDIGVEGVKDMWVATLFGDVYVEEVIGEKRILL
jgi:hypothetical protein